MRQQTTSEQRHDSFPIPQRTGTVDEATSTARRQLTGALRPPANRTREQLPLSRTASKSHWPNSPTIFSRLLLFSARSVLTKNEYRQEYFVSAHEACALFAQNMYFKLFSFLCCVKDLLLVHVINYMLVCPDRKANYLSNMDWSQCIKLEAESCNDKTKN